MCTDDMSVNNITGENLQVFVWLNRIRLLQSTGQSSSPVQEAPTCPSKVIRSRKANQKAQQSSSSSETSRGRMLFYQCCQCARHGWRLCTPDKLVHWFLVPKEDKGGHFFNAEFPRQACHRIHVDRGEINAGMCSRELPEPR